MSFFAIIALVASALGSGLIAGLFCSFSDFLMKALSKIAPARGIEAIQSINVVIVKPSFLSVFFGTGVVGLLAVGLGWQSLIGSSLVLASAGSAVYIIGCIFVTMVFNVPLNNRLAAVDPASEAGAEMWRVYQAKWTFWNHVRSLATIVSTVLFLLALLRVNV